MSVDLVERLLRRRPADGERDALAPIVRERLAKEISPTLFVAALSGRARAG